MKKVFLIAVVVLFASNAWAISPISETGFFPQSTTFVTEINRYSLATVSASTTTDPISLTTIGFDRGIIDQLCVDTSSTDFDLMLYQADGTDKADTYDEILKVENINKSYCASDLDLHFQNTDITRTSNTNVRGETYYTQPEQIYYRITESSGSDATGGNLAITFKHQ